MELRERCSLSNRRHADVVSTSAEMQPPRQVEACKTQTERAGRLSIFCHGYQTKDGLLEPPEKRELRRASYDAFVVCFCLLATRSERLAITDY